jgi:hypothetical protein
MKKIFFTISLLAFSFAIGISTLAATTTTASSTASSTAASLACASSASETRDTALITAYTSMTASTTNALTTRKTALKNAWLITDKTARKTAVKKAWDAYKTDLAKTRRAFRNAKRTIWKNYTTTRKACKGIESDIYSEYVDSDM